MNQKIIPYNIIISMKVSQKPPASILLKLIAVIMMICAEGSMAQRAASNGTVQVGVAEIDITPDGPILLAGYGGRKAESEGVLQPLRAKALAFGDDAQGASILVTVDLIGIQYYMTKEVAGRLSKKVGVDPSQFVICASHTHTGPEIGNLLNHFGRQLLPAELGHINIFLEELTDKLEQVSLAALRDRKPARLAWGEGKVTFAMNRRKVIEGKAVNMSPFPDGPVDHALPMLQVSGLDGQLRAVTVSYACHGTTLGSDVNQIHGDWMGEAQRLIQEKHPGTVALVSIGCGADANPEPRLKMEYTTQHGKEIADEVEAILSGDLHPLTSPPVGRLKVIQLPFDHVPSVQEFMDQTNARGSKGYYATRALDKIARGEVIPTTLTYPITTWTFGSDLAMVFLPGEVVVDYSLRLKRESTGGRLWVNAYSNDVPCYIASDRIFREGGYEVDYSMYSYNQPSRFKEGVEDLIVSTVHGLLPASYRKNSLNFPKPKE